jgi:hypothetical protein
MLPRSELLDDSWNVRIEACVGGKTVVLMIDLAAGRAGPKKVGLLAVFSHNTAFTILDDVIFPADGFPLSL